MFEIGQKLTQQNYAQGAIWCNGHNAHIERKGGDFVIVPNLPTAQESTAEKLARAEAQSGLTRAVREVILAQNSGVSEFVRLRAVALEDLARELRRE